MRSRIPERCSDEKKQEWLRRRIEKLRQLGKIRGKLSGYAPPRDHVEEKRVARARRLQEESPGRDVEVLGQQEEQEAM